MTVESAGANWHVEVIDAVATHDVRRQVLREGRPDAEVVFAEDDWPGAFHLGVRDHRVLVGVSSWIPRPMPTDDHASVQLRGMATLRTHQGRGVGTALLQAGLARAAAGGSISVWANARDRALAFYLAHGFSVIGEGFIDATTGLPHHRVLARLG